MAGRIVPAVMLHGRLSRNWKFVLVVPLKSVKEFWCANDGMTAWRHQSGYVIPDLCRQEGGCPEVWNASEVLGKRELPIINLSEIEQLMVLNHKQVTSPLFPEIQRSC
jgi:hypothetical protein